MVWLGRGPYARAAGVHEELEVRGEMIHGAHDAAHHAYVERDFFGGVGIVFECLFASTNVMVTCYSGLDVPK